MDWSIDLPLKPKDMPYYLLYSCPSCSKNLNNSTMPLALCQHGVNPLQSPKSTGTRLVGNQKLTISTCLFCAANTSEMFCRLSIGSASIPLIAKQLPHDSRITFPGCYGLRRVSIFILHMWVYQFLVTQAQVLHGRFAPSAAVSNSGVCPLMSLWSSRTPSRESMGLIAFLFQVFAAHQSGVRPSLSPQSSSTFPAASNI